MQMTDKVLLVTGANRGLGKALVEEALNRGAKHVYAGARQPLSHPDARVTPLMFDVTNRAQIEAAAGKIESLDMLVNNAGLCLFEDFSDRAMLDRHLATNLIGPYELTKAVLPQLARARGAIVNVLSLSSFAPAPFSPAYSVSKAAAFSMTQAMRMLLARQGVRLHAVLPGPMDTDMTRDLDIPKAATQSVACAIFDGVGNGDEEIFPDPMSATMADGWRGSALKGFERQMAAYLDEAPVKSPAGAA